MKTIILNALLAWTVAGINFSKKQITTMQDEFYVGICLARSAGVISLASGFFN